jgi:hypothetical protein
MYKKRQIAGTMICNLLMNVGVAGKPLTRLNWQSAATAADCRRWLVVFAPAFALLFLP